MPSWRFRDFFSDRRDFYVVIFYFPTGLNQTNEVNRLIESANYTFIPGRTSAWDERYTYCSAYLKFTTFDDAFSLQERALELLAEDETLGGFIDRIHCRILLPDELPKALNRDRIQAKPCQRPESTLRQLTSTN